VHPVVETLKAGKRRIDKIYLAREFAQDSDLSIELRKTELPVLRVPTDEITSLAATPHHQGIAARVGPFPYVDVQTILPDSSTTRSALLILDGIQDPGNLGNILRLADCFGADGVLLTKDRSAPITAAVEKASAGASAHVLVTRVVNLVRTIEELKQAGYWIYASDPRSGEAYYRVDLTGRIGLVLGSEGKGMRRLVRERCDASLSIPLAGRIDSLNVSQTAAVLLSESFRQWSGKQ
jgi:23S rRNA (guanosine2251-2'-O)-methyltransferase